MANTYLYKAQPGVGSSIKSTFSGWIKLANDNLTGGIYGQYYSANYLFDICLQNGHLEVADYLVNQYKMRKRTSQKLRDLNAWHHIYVAIDRSLGTAADRTKVYINGERVTDFQSSEDTNYTQQTSGSHDGNCFMNNLGDSSDFSRVGIRYDGNEFDGSMSHIYWVDGLVIDISQFGSVDNLTGEWKINTNPTISSYGQIGFLCLKDGNTITDQSPNSNNFTSSGNGVTKTEDCPSNVFATYNSLYKPRGTAQYNNGNTTISTDASNWDSGISTICATTGKYYFEVKINDNDGTKFAVGAVDIERDNSFVNNLESYSYLGYRGMGYYGGGRIIGNNGTSDNQDLVTGLGTFTTNDIIGCAVDLDNNKMYWHKNGTYIQNGGYTQNPSSGSYGLDFSNNRDGTNAVAMGGSIRDGRAIYTNYGNGYFGTSAVSSAGTNASGNGIFEYDVPTGYTALSTKGLNL
jgi:hypothetical protein